MRKTLALHKNVPIIVLTWHDIHGYDSGELIVNNVLIGRFSKNSLFNLENALEMQLIGGCKKIETMAKTIKVNKGQLFINDTFISELNSDGLWAINGAFTPISKYRILVDDCELGWVYSWSLDWHVQNLSSRVEEIETQDYKKTLKQLKKKYAPMVKHNTYFNFDIVEYRGDDFNRIILNDSVGFEPNNFDEKIRKEIFKR